jgi:hypothetical protein
MALRFPYLPVTAGHSVLSLGGRWVRPRPIVPVTIIGPADSRLLEGHLDTGADDTVFPEALATPLGLDLANAPVGEASGVGLATASLHYAEVTLRITDGTERREWRALIGFTAARLNRPLLGFAGFLQFFDATFYGGREEVELAVNGLYRGS